MEPAIPTAIWYKKFEEIPQELLERAACVSRLNEPDPDSHFRVWFHPTKDEFSIYEYASYKTMKNKQRIGRLYSP